MMTREEIIEKFNGIMSDVQIIRDDTDSPAIEASARQIEMQCHFALGLLGVVEAVFPGVVDEALKTSVAAGGDRV